MTRNRRTCRQGSPCEPRTLLEAIQCATLHSDQDSASIAEGIGVRRGYLLDAANPDREDMQFQARLLSPLMNITGNLAPLRYLAHAHGCALVELPKVEPGDSDIRRTFIKVVNNLGDNAKAIEQVLADGRVTKEEALAMERDLAVTIETLLAVKELFTVRSKGGSA